MKLRIKDEYKEFSFAGGRQKIKLVNLDPSLYQYYYERGYAEFFEEIKETKENDKNNKRNNTINLSDTDGESNID